MTYRLAKHISRGQLSVAVWTKADSTGVLFHTITIGPPELDEEGNPKDAGVRKSPDALTLHLMLLEASQWIAAEESRRLAKRAA